MADATQPEQPTITISPATADVNRHAVCKFTVDPPGAKVTWAIKPNIGNIDQQGIYTSPEEIVLPQSVIVTATAASGQTATAAIDLTDAPQKIRWLGWYAIAMALLLGIGILTAWGCLYRSPSPLQVIVNPPLVTLNPSNAINFKFAATVLGDAKSAVTWSIDRGYEIDSNGMFQQKPETTKVIDTAVKVTATSVADPTRTGTAIVNLKSGVNLEIAPQTASVFPAQQIPFRTPNAAAIWSVSRLDLASISPDGMFTAGGRSQRTEVVQVTAWGAKPQERAGVAVIITPTLGTTDYANWPLLLFAIICGSLGSMVYYASSFVSYVGNRTFRSSWFWFYISRPFVGGALAVIFYFILGSGTLSGGTGTDLMKVGTICTLVGLFSDKAVKKLSDILDVLLATKDDRKDKVVETKTPIVVAPPPAPAPPKIVSADPSSIPPNAEATVEFKGANFKAGFEVNVNGQEAAPMEPAEQSFKLRISAAQAQPPKVTITVKTDQGTAAFDLPVR